MRSILKKTAVLPISILVYMGTIFTFPSAAQDYVEDPINLLVNPDWEDGMEGWEILASNHKVLFGDHEALCSIVYQDIPVEDYMYGNAVRLSGYIALASQDSTQEYMDLALMMGGFDGYVVDGFEEDGSFTYSDYESADSTELIWHEITMDIPDEADFIRVSFEIRKQTDKNYYNFSDLSLELIEKEQTGDDSFINVTGSTYDEEPGFVRITEENQNDFNTSTESSDQEGTGGFERAEQDSTGGFERGEQDNTGGFERGEQDSTGGFERTEQDSIGGFENSGTNVIGVWYLKTVRHAGMDYDDAMNNMIFVLNEDESAILYFENSSIPSEGTWSQSGDSGTIMVDDWPMYFTINGNELIIDTVIEGHDIVMYLERDTSVQDPSSFMLNEMLYENNGETGTTEPETISSTEPVSPNSEVGGIGSEPSDTADGQKADAADLKSLVERGKAYYYGTAQNGYDREKAKEYFMEAAAAGDSEAWCYLGYLKMECTDFDRYEQAMKCFEKAYECGYGPGLVGQGMLYEDGLGVEQDYEKAFELYTQAAEEGYVEGYYGLASLYLNGNSVVLDETVALEYFKMALESQDALWRNDAKCRIASVYTEDIPGIGQDYSAAYDWYMQAANEGYGSGFIGIGNMYYYGDGVDKDYSEAYSWFQRGAAHGSSVGMFDVGYMLENGKGVDQDYEQALKYYEQAAEMGDVDAMYRAGVISANLDGEYGTTSIPAKAEYWLSIALHFTDDQEMIDDINEILPYVTPGY